MGYRSDVAYCMAFEDMDKRDAFHELVRLRKDTMSHELEQYCAKDDEFPWITCSMKDVKWYASDEDVQAHNAMLRLCVECGGAYRFVRIGEDTDDAEEREESDTDVEIPWEAFYVERRIVWG